MIDCIPDTTGKKCIHCGWVKPEKIKGWPRRNCQKSPDLEPAAARLGLTLDDCQSFAPQLYQWMKAGYPERPESERAAIAATPCESRREDGICRATGCNGNGKTIKCEWLARMKTSNCPGKMCLFGDKRAAVRAEIQKAVLL
jgi:hypothetical protein